MSSVSARTALVYDFDGTLVPGNLQEHGFLSDFGLDEQQFWKRVHEQAQEHDADHILMYLQCMLQAARAAGRPITRSSLTSLGSRVRFFDGVEGWFDRMNAYAASRGLRLEHYIVSSGNEEIIRASKLACHFERIFASKYAYDEAGVATWPAVAINYTTKTQYLFRINKGVANHWNDKAVNRWKPMTERPVPFSRMIYLGDGDTDIPSMKMVRHQGGHSIAVFDPGKWQEPATQQKVHDLISEDRANFVAPANYEETSQLDVVVKGILGRIARDAGYREPDSQ